MKYIGFYSNKISNNSNIVLSAINKMDYIAECIIENDIDVEIISFANTCDKEKTIYLSHDKIVNTRKKIHYFSSICSNNNVLFRFIKRNLLLLEAFFFLFYKIKKNETIILYHSINYWFLFIILKKIKSFRLILEVEEIYTDVSRNNVIRRWIEGSMFELADSYIYSTKGLNKIININNKPYVVINGRYKYENKFDSILKENIIHVVYAGTLDYRKGCIDAIKSSVYLPCNYHVHILGFGTNEEVKLVTNTIKELRNKIVCQVTYDGILVGDNFTRFIQSCNIGLCTQDPNSKFNSTSFPSKILTYLCNGLGVVAINIPAIKESEVASLLTFYDKQDPYSIAYAIMNTDSSKEVINLKINNLHNRFVEDLNKILKL